MVVGVYPGDEGSLAHAALKRYFENEGNPQKSMQSVEDFGEVFKAVMKDENSVGIVPMDNSTSGTFRETYEHLLKHSGVHIVGEWYQSHSLCLCAKPGAKLKDIKTVLSHPAILESCQVFLKKRKLQTRGTSSSSTACKMLTDAPGGGSFKGLQIDESCGAIASQCTAEQYGLTMLKKLVSDDQNLTSRFILISAKKLPAFLQDKYQNTETKWKCSLAMDLVDKPMSMVKALSCISFRDLQIDKVQTFPLNKEDRRHFAFWLYTDFKPTNLSQADTIVKSLGDFTVELHNFGTYPVHEYQDEQVQMTEEDIRRNESFENVNFF